MHKGRATLTDGVSQLATDKKKVTSDRRIEKGMMGKYSQPKKVIKKQSENDTQSFTLAQ